MGIPSKKLIRRAHRYILDPSDNHMLVFSGEQSAERIQADIINISTTGVGFLVDSEKAPHFGTIIKMQFSVPNHGIIAWWGRVVRVEVFERHKPWSKEATADKTEYVFVGIAFEHLPDGHLENLREGLKEKFIQVARRRRLQKLLVAWDFITQFKVQIILYTSLTLGTIYALYALTRPTENYDRHRGTPWGQRFQFFEFEKHPNDSK